MSFENINTVPSELQDSHSLSSLTNTPPPQVEETTNLESPPTKNDNSSSTSLPSDFLTASVPLPQPPENPANTVPSKTLWMGDLEAWWDENFIAELWNKLDKHVEVKVIKPKHSLLMHQLAKTNGQGIVNHSGYCFIEFDSPEKATDALSLNGTLIPDTNNKSFRLNWASAATLDSQIAQTPEFSLFVGDLSATTTEAHLLALFQSHFNSIKTVRVMTDPSSGLSRCFGFVRFSNDDDRKRALVEMNGKWLGGRQIRVALASPKHQNMKNNNNNFQNPNQYNNFNDNNQIDLMNSQIPQMGFYQPYNQPLINDSNNTNNSNNDNSISTDLTTIMSMNSNDPNNTTVFVGGLANGLYEDALAALFEPFGTIKSIKVPQGKGCGFVRFANRIDAERAIEGMQGFVIGGSRVRLSWGRPNIKNHMRQQQMFSSSNINNNMNNNMHYNNYGNNNANFINSQLNPSQVNGTGDYNINNGASKVPNMAIFNGQPPQAQTIISRPIFEYPQGIPPVMSPPQAMVDTYHHDGTPQGTHATLVSIPAGMPPPFIYDPYFNNNMNVVPNNENQGIPPQQPAMMSHGSSGIIEPPKGVVPIRGPIPPQQYAIDQNGQYMYVSTQPFPNNAMIPNSKNLYNDNNDSDGNNTPTE